MDAVEFRKARLGVFGFAAFAALVLIGATTGVGVCELLLIPVGLIWVILMLSLK